MVIRAGAYGAVFEPAVPLASRVLTRALDPAGQPLRGPPRIVDGDRGDRVVVAVRIVSGDAALLTVNPTSLKQYTPAEGFVMLDAGRLLLDRPRTLLRLVEPAGHRRAATSSHPRGYLDHAEALEAVGLPE